MPHLCAGKVSLRSFTCLEAELISNYISRIVRAFLIEEQKIVAKVLKAQQAAVKSKA